MPLIGKNLACPPHADRIFWRIFDIFNHRVFLEAERFIIKSYAGLFEFYANQNPVARIQTLDADKIAHSIVAQYLPSSDLPLNTEFHHGSRQKQAKVDQLNTQKAYSLSV